jgi:hypothetical protein
MNQVISKITSPFPYLKIENMYSDEELELIAEELNFLNYEDKLENPFDTNTARDSNGNSLKQNRGLFLDDLYKKREISNILKVNRKIFNCEYLDAYANLSFGYKSIKECNFDSTLISYYENSHYYKPHKDISMHTAVTWFFKEPKLFEGGNLYFNEYNEKIEIQHNMTIIFPSFLLHSVEEIKMKQNIPFGYGRYCMTQFIQIK